MKVVGITEHKDGTATITLDISMKEEVMFQKYAKKLGKKCTKAFIKKTIYDGLIESLEREKKTLKASKAPRS
jgi:RecA/RadA recombinase